MNLDKILEYQKIDQEVYKVELDLLRSKEMAKINNVKNQLGLAESALLRLNKETDDFFRAVEALEKDIASLSGDKTGADGANSIEKIEATEQALNACLEGLTNIEKESKKIFDKLAVINKDAAKQYELGRHLSNELRKAKDEYNTVLNRMKGEHQQNFVRLGELTAEIDPKLLARYKTLREHRRMPAIVPYSANNCTACGMNIAIEVGDKLKNPGDIAECPNCRRLIYLK